MANETLAEALDRAVQHQMSVLELVGAAERLRQTYGAEAIANLYKTWLEHNEQDPLLYAVLFNYSAVLTDIGDIQAAREALEKSTKLNPDFAPSRINLGRVYERLGSPSQSVEQWSAAIEHLSEVSGMGVTHKITALNQMARVLEAGNQDDASENMLRQSLEIDTTQREVVQHYLAARQRLCEWPLIVPWDRVSRETLMRGISPLSLSVYTDDPMLQLAVNAYYNRCDVGDPVAEPVSSYWAACEGRTGKPLRIGYLSSDLREHAIGFLMAELFELHDRKEVESFVYYCGVIPDDEMMRRIKGTVDHWVSINDMDDVTAARRMADDGIQILVDINGYTRDGRTKILPLKPAPIIVNWLGFPGSLGTPYHHYVIADDWIVPPESEMYFSEKVLRLPCYQPNDRKRHVAERTPTRAEMNLPEEAMVYCCFNGTQKISRFTFDRWIEILRRVPQSVLWLLSGTEKAHANLRAYVEARGIAGDRLIFADKKPNPEHLARYPLADLFLDTSPYGAHTTASDALWMGVPVVTLNGKSFASRVCGSLVRAAGLPELACATSKEYVDRAVALGKDKEARIHYREKLAASRDTCDLFNTPKLVAALEGLYRQMWDDYEAGRLPQPDLHNLDVYLEVGIKQDHDALEVQTIENYKEWWVEKLAERHKIRSISVDERLWTAEERAQKEPKK